MTSFYQLEFLAKVTFLLITIVATTTTVTCSFARTATAACGDRPAHVTDGVVSLAGGGAPDAGLDIFANRKTKQKNSSCTY